MNYNIKNLTIYCGLICLVLAFILVAIFYLYCKLRSDTKARLQKMISYSSIDNQAEWEQKVELILLLF